MCRPSATARAARRGLGGGRVPCLHARGRHTYYTGGVHMWRKMSTPARFTFKSNILTASRGCINTHTHLCGFMLRPPHTHTHTEQNSLRCILCRAARSFVCVCVCGCHDRIWEFLGCGARAFAVKLNRKLVSLCEENDI